MTEPLNPALYQAIVRTFGTVRITNAGQAARLVPGRHPRTGAATVRVDPACRGEHYHFHCPFCPSEGAARYDARMRASVSYLFGLKLGEVAGFPDIDEPPALYLSNCWNETHCLPRHSAQLWAMLFDRLLPHERVFLQEYRIETARGWTPGGGTRGPGPLAPPEIPADAVPVDQLEPDHPAVVYLRDRRFCPRQLVRDYDVRYCTGQTTRHSYLRDRLIMPVHAPDGTLLGVQARLIPPAPERRVPKYYFHPPGLPKATTLYALDRARPCDTVVVVEGVTDVWRLGRGAVATFGSSIGPSQQALLLPFARRPRGVIVWARDPGVVAATARGRQRDQAVQEALQAQLEGRLVVVDLETGDPADQPADRLWTRIAAACHARGFDWV